MEENTTSWKNHSFTLMVFGGIVVLCSIFFVLGMLVGRTQGQSIAEAAFAAKSEKRPVAANAGEDFPLNYYSETTEEKPDLTLQPPSPPSPQPAVTEAPATAGSSSTAQPDPSAKTSAKPSAPVKLQPETKRTPAKTTATAKPATARNPAAEKPSVGKQTYLQVLSTKNQKQAASELKKVEAKGLRARIFEVTQKNERWFRVYVGPYKESEVGLAKSDLKAKGYKDVFVAK